MKLHERAYTIQKAEAELNLLMIELRSKHDLTFAEEIRMLASRIEFLSSLLIRSERSNDSE